MNWGSFKGLLGSLMPERPSDRATERPSERPIERAIARSSNRTTQRTSETEDDHNSGSRRAFETLTSPFCSIVLN